jgi:phthiocerol/phenolphthiocerol synthesis type-I polyketide synthase E
LFLVHGAEGNVLLYRQLIQHLGPDQPVYGLQSRGLSGDGSFHTTIRDMAAQYVNEVVEALPQGPYLLGGYCLGGSIALEMAQQLTASGKKVELVILLDTYNNSVVPHSKALLEAPVRAVQNAWFHGANALSLDGRDRARFLREKLDIAIARAGIAIQGIYHAFQRFGSLKKTHHYPHLIVKKINHQAVEDYEPSPYHGRVVLIRSKGAFVGFDSSSLGWKECIGEGLKIHELPFYPRGMLIEPFCRSLAQTLKLALDEKP